MSNREVALFLYVLAALIAATLILLLIFGRWAILFLPISVLLVGGGLYFVYHNSDCPNCERIGAKINVDEEFLGTFRKNVRRARTDGNDWKENIALVQHEKIRYYHRCRYCNHEWVTTASREM